MKPNDILLTDLVAFITGGGGGIGRAIALAYASVGAKVAIADIVLERCEEVVERAKEMGSEALALPTDVCNVEQLQSNIQKAYDTFGRLDILVNNAGGVNPKPFLEQSERSWRKHIDINLVSMLAATSAASPLMIAGGQGGSIINIASIEASRAAPNYAVYAACKAGMLNFTRTMALELADHNIRVNAIAPDYTVTPGTRGNFNGSVDPSSWFQPTEAQQIATKRRIPMGRAGIDEECGRAAVYLSSKMSSYVTGITLPVDGGTWASSGWIRDRNGKWTLTGEQAI